MVRKQRRFFGTLPEVEVQHPTMAQLEADVAAALAHSGEVDAADVKVTAALGEATLSGWVSRDEEVERCTEIACAVPGVRSVRNLLSVRESNQAPE